MLCKICKNEVKESLIFDILSLREHVICQKCFSQLKPNPKVFQLKQYPITSLYVYEDLMKETIYRFKGCFDYELKDVFLDYFKRYIERHFKGYTIAFAPSDKQANATRGFNHVEALCQQLKNPKVDCFYKTSNYKQSDHDHASRAEVARHIGIDLQNKKIDKLLIVDDIITTGNTLFACAELAEKCRIKSIKLLAVCNVSNCSKIC